jgi:branched-chain amino acid transport system permease protein
MQLDFLVQVLLIGLSNGLLLALIAIGYTLVYGIIELINFAHGEVFMLGTMLALTLVTAFGLSGATNPLLLFPVLLGILLVVMLFTAGLNTTIERLAYRPLRRAPRLAPLITAIGVSFILLNIGLLWKGASQVNFPTVIPVVDLLGGSSPIFTDTNIKYTTRELFVLVVALPLVIALELFVARTRLGKAMRATAQDQEAAALMGINVNTTIALTFILGGALAGAAGLIYGIYFTSAWFLQGFRGGLFAFTSAVLGGIGNIRGAFLGGILIGLIQAFSDFFINPAWTLVVVFAILILILVFRPSGLLGEAVPERA